jgi:hypothetical protein
VTPKIQFHRDRAAILIFCELATPEGASLAHRARARRLGPSVSVEKLTPECALVVSLLSNASVTLWRPGEGFAQEVVRVM